MCMIKNAYANNTNLCMRTVYLFHWRGGFIFSMSTRMNNCTKSAHVHVPGFLLICFLLKWVTTELHPTGLDISGLFPWDRSHKGLQQRVYTPRNCNHRGLHPKGLHPRDSSHKGLHPWVYTTRECIHTGLHPKGLHPKGLHPRNRTPWYCTSRNCSLGIAPARGVHCPVGVIPCGFNPVGCTPLWLQSCVGCNPLGCHPFGCNSVGCNPVWVKSSGYLDCKLTELQHEYK